jgi:hypothetical protein
MHIDSHLWVSDYILYTCQTKELEDLGQRAFDPRRSIALYKTKKLDHFFHIHRYSAVNNALCPFPATNTGNHL